MDTLDEETLKKLQDSPIDEFGITYEFIVVKRGFVNVHRYYIPADKIDG